MSQAAELNLEDALQDYSGERDDLIPLLQDIQSRYRYLPEPVLREVSRRFSLPLNDVFHVATFYNCFSLEPVGKHLVQVCLGTACHVRGAPRVLDRLLQELKLGSPGTTKDLAFTVREVRCIGCCGLAPAVQIDDRVHARMKQSRVPSLVRRCRQASEG